MKLGFKRGQKGFTLVELMVVVGILAVLMSIVVPAVTGTKSTSITAQVQSDADATQKALDNFQNKGVTSLYPEEDLGTNAKYKLPANTTLTRKDGTIIAVDNATATTVTVPGVTKGTAGTASALGTITNYAAGQSNFYKEIKWNRTTRVWQSDGTVNNAMFVPDFLVREPSSVDLDNDENIANSAANGVMLAEFLWLVKVNNPGSGDESRTLEVYRLTSGNSTKAYTQIY